MDLYYLHCVYFLNILTVNKIRNLKFFDKELKTINIKFLLHTILKQIMKIIKIYLVTSLSIKK